MYRVIGVGRGGDARVSLLMLLVLILHTCLMLRKNVVVGRCQRTLNMCTLGVHGTRVVFDTFSCSRTCTCLAYECVSADITRKRLLECNAFSHFFKDKGGSTSVVITDGAPVYPRFGSCNYTGYTGYTGYTDHTGASPARAALTSATSVNQRKPA